MHFGVCIDHVISVVGWSIGASQGQFGSCAIWLEAASPVSPVFCQCTLVGVSSVDIVRCTVHLL